MRFKKLIAVAAVGLGVLSVAGAAVAATHGKTATKPATGQVTSVDTDNVQQGDQTSPDNAAETTKTVDTDNVQEGDQTSSDNSAEESTSETAGESDGPGGHEDPPGNVDHQFEGEE